MATSRIAAKSTDTNLRRRQRGEGSDWRAHEGAEIWVYLEFGGRGSGVWTDAVREPLGLIFARIGGADCDRHQLREKTDGRLRPKRLSITGVHRYDLPALRRGKANAKARLRELSARHRIDARVGLEGHGIGLRGNQSLNRYVAGSGG